MRLRGSAEALPTCCSTKGRQDLPCEFRVAYLSLCAVSGIRVLCSLGTARSAALEVECRRCSPLARHAQQAGMPRTTPNWRVDGDLKGRKQQHQWCSRHKLDPTAAAATATVRRAGGRQLRICGSGSGSSGRDGPTSTPATIAIWARSCIMCVMAM